MWQRFCTSHVNLNNSKRQCVFLPSSSVFSSVQLVLSITFLKWGWFFGKPVSKMATLTPSPSKELNIFKIKLVFLFRLRFEGTLSSHWNFELQRAQNCNQHTCKLNSIRKDCFLFYWSSKQSSLQQKENYINFLHLSLTFLTKYPSTGLTFYK